MSKNINYYESSNGQAKVENDLSPIQAKLYIGAGAERKEGAGKGLTLLPTHSIFTLRRVTENMFVKLQFQITSQPSPLSQGTDYKNHTLVEKRIWQSRCCGESGPHRTVRIMDVNKLSSTNKVSLLCDLNSFWISK